MFGYPYRSSSSPEVLIQ